MRLLCLSLKNWRGTDSRSIRFSDGITLIEGPNEIGKSTIIEAVRMLFSEMDSSKKRDVKAIQPVGQDVGSQVEVEVKAGDYHFEYAKTYNKATQTSLNILAPLKKQLTGREAHDEVVRILGETVDMTLWEALLVDQGERVGLANLQDSAGLAKALDEAAGSTSTGNEDAGLFGAVETEYEKYFTLKTGKSRFSRLQAAYETAQQALEDAVQAIDEVEEDSQSHGRSAAEVRRLISELPNLKSKKEEHENNWAAIKSLNEKVEAKEKELSAAEAVQKAATDASQDRLALIADITQNEKSLAEAQGSQAPLREKASALKKQSRKARLETSDLRKEVKTAKSALELAHADEKYLKNLAALTANKGRLEQLDEISKTMKSELKVAGSIKIDDEKLENFRETERRLDIVSGRRDSAATTVTVTAEKNIDLEIGAEKISLKPADTEARAVASELLIRLPGIASLQLTPPRSVAELQDEADDANAEFEKLKIRFDVKNLKAAESLNERRKTAEREVDRLKEREDVILEGDSREEIEQAISSLQSDHDDYIAGRNSDQQLPQGISDASGVVFTMKSELDSKEASLESAREEAESLQGKYGQVDSELRLAQQDLDRLEGTLIVMRERLEGLRSNETDEALAKRVAETDSAEAKLKEECRRLGDRLAESSPDSVEALVSNATNVYNRASSDLQREQQNLAVLADRLQHAQADGRYEEMEAAARLLEEAESELMSTKQRADAVGLLWRKLNEYRDAARQTYVRPLKEAIERLGSIVFGSGFEVQIGDDWAILSRTLHGKTLPFNDLSVGAREQLGVLTRLAAAQIVSRQGGVPLIIDDALGFSDPSRLETMGAAIAAAGKLCQIIILTCTPGRFTHVGSAEVVRF
jgi:DNA repair exonuclease SbcCD ATPase subunit